MQIKGLDALKQLSMLAGETPSGTLKSQMLIDIANTLPAVLNQARCEPRRVRICSEVPHACHILAGGIRRKRV